MYRNRNIVIIALAALIIIAAGRSYAQVPIPNPAWPLDSVVNRSVHFYTVPGDPNYTDPSTFVWNVYGGRLFYDADTLMPAGNGTTAVAYGNSENITIMWVKWNINTQLDTGYVYVYEISADSCQRSKLDEGKYQGMRIKISAPPIARFIGNEYIACSNYDSARIIMEIEGMPPYDLTYSVNGEVFQRQIVASDLADWDGDGEVDNISFLYSNLSSYVSDSSFDYEILDISSGGVPGKIIPDSTYSLIVHIQPTAPMIAPEWTEVTAGYDYTFHLLDRGVNPTEWYWDLHDINTNLVDIRDWSSEPNYQCFFSSSAVPGKYYLQAQYVDTYGCKSPFTRWDLELFGLPTIQFAEDDTIINCSATTLVPDEIFELKVHYYGARTYGYTYIIYDYTGTAVGSGAMNDLNDWESTIIIKNDIANGFINTTDGIKPWKVVLNSATNEDPRLNVTIIPEHSTRVIMIYPKPIILDDIDFAN